MNPPRNPASPSKLRICLAPILIVMAMVLLLVLGAFHQELPGRSGEWLGTIAVVFNLAGLAAAWGVRRHLVGRASMLAALVLMSVVVWEFFRQ